MNYTEALKTVGRLPPSLPGRLTRAGAPRPNVRSVIVPVYRGNRSPLVIAHRDVVRLRGATRGAAIPQQLLALPGPVVAPPARYRVDILVLPELPP